MSDPNINDDVWSGIFAMSYNNYSSLYHVSVTVPSVAVKKPADYASLDMYIQTDIPTGMIKYIGCTADIWPNGLILQVKSGLGNNALVTCRTVHREKSMSLDQRTMDCTLVTNGDNYFSETINGEGVFVSDKLNLHMPPAVQFVPANAGHGHIWHSVRQVLPLLQRL